MFRFKYMLVAIAFLAPTGCATTYPECEKFAEDTPEMVECQSDIREWRRGIDKENYINCVVIYEATPKAWMVHKGHSHGKRDRVKNIDVTGDLMDNNCRYYLQDQWADY